MTREEVQGFLAMVQAAYPNYNPQSKTAAVNAWTMALEEYDSGQVALAFKAYMTSNTSGFAPVPGQIVDKIHMMSEPEELNELEAWSLVSRAMQNSGYNSAEEFVKLPLAVQKAVGSPGQLRTWALDENYNEEVNSSNFIKCYRVVLQRQKEINRMPEKVKDLIRDANKRQASLIEQEKQRTIESAADRKQKEIKALETRESNPLLPEHLKKLDTARKELLQNVVNF